ncbi:uncharacterized protein EI97DRAFT_439963 [Westerdykella ornata]|uniref:Uncharacterized protein n=1 Tax=Westerdykella ornata TaxID=318751 RepID=A0A6A6JV73_WESOR|nr:uncharacterized protein EI97DRAFT_439963 [Westerdykella ornata]KAF2279646.1 hypothetical protein EI97DRAFT_439963 [Westerdykella ornata]
MATATACPIVGTTNDVLPPNHPDIDLSKQGQKCPVVGATTDHHHNLHKHPPVHIEGAKGGPIATACPVLKQVVEQPKSKAMDDEICPVVGTATTVLPPDHPSTKDAKEGDVCPVTKATVGHHKSKVHEHPDVKAAHKGAVCPVAGVKV